MTPRLYDILAVLLIAALSGVVWWQWQTDKPVVEDPKPAVVQSDQSVVIERTATAPTARPKHKTPKGAKVERVIGVDVQPDGVGIKPVHVDLSLVREEDGGRRVIASSPDGEIVGGLDIPVETLPPERKGRSWAAGLNLDPIHQTFGVWLDRDWRRLRVGVEANQVAYKGGGHGGEVRLKLGVTF